MLHREFGRTALSMPVLTNGAMRFQHSWKATDEVDPASQRNLEACVRRALELGICHFETARGYGTSEAQLGQILPRLPRDDILVQTKISPTDSPDEFVRNFDDSMRRLDLEYVDLLALHGVNDETVLEWSVRPGGCLEQVDGQHQ